MTEPRPDPRAAIAPPPSPDPSAGESAPPGAAGGEPLRVEIPSFPAAPSFRLVPGVDPHDPPRPTLGPPTGERARATWPAVALAVAVAVLVVALFVLLAGRATRPGAAPRALPTQVE